MDENTEQQEIDAGARVALFLKDEAVIAAFERLKGQYYAAFMSSEDPAKIQAKALALDEIQAELRSVEGTGTRAAANAERREKSRKR